MLQLVDVFDIKPGRTPDAIRLIQESKPHQEQLGGKNVRFAVVVTGGPSSGIFYQVTEFDSLSDYGAFRRRAYEISPEERTRHLEEWVGPESPITRVQNALQTLIHETGSWPDDGAALLTRSWEVQPGRLSEFLALVDEVGPLTARHGGGTRLFRWTVAGPNTGDIVSTARFPDEESLYRYLDEAEHDAGMQAIVDRLSASDSPATMTSWIVSRVLDR